MYNFQSIEGYSELHLRYLEFLNYVSWFLRKISFTHLRTGIRTAINKKILKDIYRMNLSVEGFIHAIDSNKISIKSEETSAFALKSFDDLLTNFRSLHSKLESSDFFQNSEIRELSNQALSNIFSAKFKLRDIYFQYHSEPQIESDKYLVEIASEMSLKSLEVVS